MDCGRRLLISDETLFVRCIIVVDDGGDDDDDDDATDAHTLGFYI